MLAHTCFFPGLGLWAWERVHPCDKCPEPRGLGAWPIRPCIHGNGLHLRWRRERRSNPVSESLWGHCQRRGGARTGHRHHPRLWPRLSPDQASFTTDECRSSYCTRDIMIESFTHAHVVLCRYSLQGDTKKYFSIGKYSGELKTVQALDREENSTYTMKVIAVDGSKSASLL